MNLNQAFEEELGVQFSDEDIVECGIDTFDPGRKDWKKWTLGCLGICKMLY